jgi:hypothetical protein
VLTERAEKICAWMMVPALTFFGLAMILAMRFVPPLSPGLGAGAIASIYRANSAGMLIGSVLMMFGGAFLMPFVAAVASAMMRMGGGPRAFALTELSAGILTYTPLFLSSFFFAVAAFRIDRPANDVLLMSDLGWMFLVMPTPPYLVMLSALGLAIFRDDAERPVFPRWIAYFNFWVGILSLPGVLIPIFKTGPFAWDGLLAFWLPLVIFGIWGPVMVWALVNTGPGTAARFLGEKVQE